MLVHIADLVSAPLCPSILMSAPIMSGFDTSYVMLAKVVFTI